MTESNLLDAFIKALFKKINKKSELVNYIANTLEIQKESAVRRLNKTVYFTVSEMGILASKLGISIDGILKYEYDTFPVYRLQSPKSVSSLDNLRDWMESELSFLDYMSKDPIEYGLIFNSFPLEIVIPYPNLLRFVYFKWGYYFLDSDLCNDFSSWQIPSQLAPPTIKVMDVFGKLEDITYIWDVTALSCLLKDIEYFINLKVLDLKDIELIKIDLHQMLDDLNKVANGICINHMNANKIQIYISTLHIGSNFSYFLTPTSCFSSFQAYFQNFNYSDNYAACIQIRSWMNSMKKVCTLISGSGAKERKLFFEDQHRIIDIL